MALAEQGLTAAGFKVTTRSRPHLGHGIDPEGLDLGGGFLKAGFGA